LTANFVCFFALYTGDYDTLSSVVEQNAQNCRSCFDISSVFHFKPQQILKFLSFAVGCISIVLGGGQSFVGMWERSDEVALDQFVAKDTYIPSISEPIFKQQAMREFIPDPMQDCTKDATGIYTNIAGSCAGDCLNGKMLVVYDDSEGFCCCE
jgi:hypothetical protein